MTEQKHVGSCLCGSVRFKVTGKPKSSIFCHCEYCQKRTGSSVALLVYYHTNSVESITGPLKKHRHISDESGRWIDSEFCANCGSPVTWTLELIPSWRGFEGGSFDNTSNFKCNAHQWCDNAHPSFDKKPSDICYNKQVPFTTEQLEKL